MKKLSFNKLSIGENLILEKDTYCYNKSDALKTEYSFSNTTNLPKKSIGILIKDKKDFVFDGNGSEIVFTGQMTPIAVDSCENVVIKNLSIDFEPPLVAEGEVVGKEKDYLLVKIDKDKFPYTVKNDWLWFDIGERELSSFFTWSCIHYDKELCISTGSGDDLIPNRVVSDGELVRIYADGLENKAPYEGWRLVLRHNERLHPGIFIENCKNVKIENVWIKSCGGLGVLAQFSEDIYLDSVTVIPDNQKGRYVSSGHDDGLQSVSNRGVVSVENCRFMGLMDDPINVHGCSLKLISAEGNIVKARYMHPQANNFDYFARKGDLLNILDSSTLQVIKTVAVDSWQKIDDREIQILLKEELSLSGDGYAIENISATPEFICKGNHFGSCRARGVLVTTPKKVVIEDNVFLSSGSAILISGDANGWYESGACHDVLIKNNTFTDKTLSSMYEFTEGVISICPVIPKPNLKLPFHKNITVKGNKFYSPDTTVLYCFSCEGLKFEDNTIIKSNTREPVTNRALLSFSYSSNVQISHNETVGEFGIELFEQENCENIKITHQQ